MKKKAFPRQIKIYPTEGGTETYRVLKNITRDQFGNILFHLDGKEVLEFNPDRDNCPTPDPTWIAYINLTGRIGISGRCPRPFIFTFRRYKNRDWYREEKGVFRFIPESQVKSRAATRKRGRPRDDETKQAKVREKSILSAIDTTRKTWGNQGVYTHALEALGASYSLSEIRRVADRERKRKGRLVIESSDRK